MRDQKKGKGEGGRARVGRAQAQMDESYVAELLDKGVGEVVQNTITRG